jgi:hypothetical protein
MRRHAAMSFVHRRIDLRRITTECRGDRELERSLLKNALREIAGDIEKEN